MICSIYDPGADTIIDILSSRGFDAYYVGGCVRDVMMGRIPHDYDIATGAEPEICADIIRNAGFAVIETGLKHGTVTAVLNGRPYEITTFRADGAYTDHRRPSEVSYVKNIRDDLSRRDFTVNAMAADRNGNVTDHFGGVYDIKRRLIRCVGDPETRFKEDALRIMRAIRFAAVLDFTIEKETSDAIRSCKDLLKMISAERISQELTLLLTSGRPSAYIREYIDVFGVFMPEIMPSVGFRQNNPWHIYDVFEHTMAALDNTPPDITTRLAVLLHDIGKPYTYSEDESGTGHFKEHAAVGADMARKILSRLRFPSSVINDVFVLVKHHDDRTSPDSVSVKRLMRRLGPENAARIADVELADSIAHNPVMVEDRIKDIYVIKDMIGRIERDNACIRISDLSVDGNDIISLGVPQGKRVGEILSTLLDAVIDERVPNDKEALTDLAKSILQL